MKIKAVQGYLMAYNFMLCYKEENTPKNDLALIDKQLEVIVNSYKRKDINMKKHLKLGWEFFGNYVGDEEKPVSVLAFIVQLIVKNPDKNKYKALTNLAIKLNDDKKFSKDSLIFDAKVLVNRFYGLVKE
jgi:hypothetical protein